MTRALALLRRAGRYAWDNPSAEQDARRILSSLRLGAVLGLVTLLVLVAAGLALLWLPEEDRVLRRVVVEVGVGPYLTLVALGTLTLCLALVVPIHASGLLEGPRWRGYLDQLVTTGMSPARYFLGKWATSQPYFLALIAATLPFVALFGLLGGLSLGRTALSYALLWLWANLLLVATLGLGVVLHEVIALALVLLLAAGALAVDLTPAPSAFAGWTPLRYLAQPLVAAASGTDAAELERLYGDARLLGATLPGPAWSVLRWALVGAAAAITCLVGPLHAFVPGLNGFGAVVLQGDARRAFFRRMRPFVTRRVDLAFLFENRGPRLVRLTLPLRAAAQLLVVAVAAAGAVGFVFHPDLLRGIRWLDPILAFDMVGCSLVLSLTLFLLRGGRAEAALAWRVGGRDVPLLVVDAAVLALVCGGLVALHTGAVLTAWPDLGGLVRTGRTSGLTHPEAFLYATTASLDVLVGSAVVGFLVLKAAGARVLGGGAALLVTSVWLTVQAALPAIPYALGSGFSRAPDSVTRAFAGPLLAIGLASPAAALEAVSDVATERGGGGDLLLAHWLWQGAFAWVFGAYAWAGHRERRAEALALEALRRGAQGPHPACPACGGPRARVAWTWWGGAVGTALVGLARCLDCGRVARAADPAAGWTRAAALAFAARAALGVTLAGAALSWALGLGGAS